MKLGLEAPASSGVAEELRPGSEFGFQPDRFGRGPSAADRKPKAKRRPGWPSYDLRYGRGAVKTRPGLTVGRLCFEDEDEDENEHEDAQTAAS